MIMKTLLTVYLVTLFYNVAYGLPDNCKGAKPLEFNPKMVEESKDNTNFVILFATPMEEWPFFTDKPETIPNLCSPAGFLTFLECSNMESAVDTAKTDARYITTEVYSAKFQNYVTYSTKKPLISKTHFVYQGGIVEMYYTDKNGNKIQIKEEDIPQFVLYSQSQAHALVATDEKRNWSIFMACNERQIWLAMDKNYYEKTYLVDQNVRNEILQVLKKVARHLDNDNANDIKFTEVPRVSLPVKAF